MNVGGTSGGHDVLIGWARRLRLSQSALNKLRVLFVDDEAAIRDVMRIELPRMGHETAICEDGQAAIAAIEKNTFDVAIVDLRMPGISGWDVGGHLRAVSPEAEI